MSSKQVTLGDDFGSSKSIEHRDVVRKQAKHSTQGVAQLLEAMTIEEFDAVVNGDLDVDEVYDKYGVKR